MYNILLVMTLCKFNLLCVSTFLIAVMHIYDDHPLNYVYAGCLL